MKPIASKSVNWQSLADWVNTRPSRERLLMLGTFLIALSSLIAYSLMPYLQTQQEIAARSLDTYLSQIAKRSQDIYAESRSLNDNSNITTENRISKLRQQIINYDPRLNEVNQSFIEPKGMLPFIKTLLDQQQLNIKHVENYPPKPLAIDSQENINIFKHGIYIEANGNYRDHIRFLKKLESLPWHIFWDEFQLDVEEDGSTTVSLELYTLNFKSDWLEI